MCCVYMEVREPARVQARMVVEVAGTRLASKVSLAAEDKAEDVIPLAEEYIGI